MASCRPLASQFQQTNLEARYFHSIAKNSESAVVSLQSESISTAMLKADRILWTIQRSKRKPEAGVLKSGDLMATAKTDAAAPSEKRAPSKSVSEERALRQQVGIPRSCVGFPLKSPFITAPHQRSTAISVISDFATTFWVLQISDRYQPLGRDFASRLVSLLSAFALLLCP